MVKVRVPATTANIGIGFDCLGIALNLYTYFTFEKSDDFQISGCEERFQTKDNLIYKSYLKTLEYLNKEIGEVHITIDSNVPISRGLGSSATCVVGGVVGAFAMTDTPLNKEKILAVATEIEGHPDNVAPAIYGGLNASFQTEKHVWNVKYDIDKRFQFLALIPNFETKTSDARKALPTTLAYSTVVENMAKLSVALKAFECYRKDILKDAIQDQIHEPYRKQLIHEYESVKTICEKEASICFYISGSGSTLMNVVDEHTNIAKIRKELQQLHYLWEAKLLEVEREGVVLC